MVTGKYGVKLWCYAVAAFIFGVLDLYLGIIAVAAFAIIAEKDKWLNNQVIQALLLYLLYSLIILVIDWSIGGLAKLFVLLELFSAATTLGRIINIIKDIFFVVYLVFVIVAVFRCISGKDGVSFLSKISNKLIDIKDRQATQTKNDIDNSKSENKQDSDLKDKE